MKPAHMPGYAKKRPKGMERKIAKRIPGLWFWIGDLTESDE
jgi:hypothetical protein